jgi:hypothetical protein
VSNILSDQDQLFLDCLFNKELNPSFDPQVAWTLAEYPSSDPLQKVIRRLKNEYQQEVQNYFLSITPFAAAKLNELAVGAKPIPNSDKVHKAATEILDRAGVTKKDKQEIEISTVDNILVLPEIKKRTTE